MKSLKGEKTLGAVQQFGSFGVKVESHRFPQSAGGLWCSTDHLVSMQEGRDDFTIKVEDRKCDEDGVDFYG